MCVAHGADVTLPPRPAGREKVIIDTDPGIDDMMALFQALAAHNRGEIEVCW